MRTYQTGVDFFTWKGEELGKDEDNVIHKTTVEDLLDNKLLLKVKDPEQLSHDLNMAVSTFIAVKIKESELPTRSDVLPGKVNLGGTKGLFRWSSHPYIMFITRLADIYTLHTHREARISQHFIHGYTGPFFRFVFKVIKVIGLYEARHSNQAIGKKIWRILQDRKRHL